MDAFASIYNLQCGIDLNKILGQTHHSVANRSRKFNGFAAMLMKRERSISYISGYNEV